MTSRQDPELPGRQAGRDGASSPDAPRGSLKAYAAHALLALALIMALAGAVYWLAARPAPRKIEVILPTPTVPAPMLVHVSGAVASPGLYLLDPGARVADAITMAGGPAEGADLGAVNLAGFLTDGVRLTIPGSDGAGSGQTSPPTSINPALSGIDLNTATFAELMTLPQVGATRAQAIIDFRETSGPIQRVDDLLQISGIGPATVEGIRPLVAQR